MRDRQLGNEFDREMQRVIRSRLSGERDPNKRQLALLGYALVWAAAHLEGNEESLPCGVALRVPTVIYDTAIGQDPYTQRCLLAASFLLRSPRDWQWAGHSCLAAGFQAATIKPIDKALDYLRAVAAVMEASGLFNEPDVICPF